MYFAYEFLSSECYFAEINKPFLFKSRVGDLAIEKSIGRLSHRETTGEKPHKILDKPDPCYVFDQQRNFTMSILARVCTLNVCG